MARTGDSTAKRKTFLGGMFDRFAEKAALTVMIRATMENALAPKELDDLFEKVAERQYTRELLFSTLVALMAVVVCRVRKSVRAAHIAMAEDIPVSLVALYKKLDGTEPALSAAPRLPGGFPDPASSPTPSARWTPRSGATSAAPGPTTRIGRTWRFSGPRCTSTRTAGRKRRRCSAASRRSTRVRPTWTIGGSLCSRR